MTMMNNIVRTEAILHTLQNGQELELRLPPQGAATPMMKLLAAVLMRAEEEYGWWEDQVRWFDAEVAKLQVEVRRKHIKLVSRDAK